MSDPSAQTESVIEPRHHLLIAGTGRAGTSVLVRILTACGFDTELSRNAGAFWDDTASAGLETIPLLPGEHPYVVKSPWSFQFVRQLLNDPTVRLDHVLVPVRSLGEATASRIVLDVQQLYRNQPALLDLEEDWTANTSTPGGVIYSLEPLDVARFLAHSFHLLIEVLVERDIPVHLLAFPRFCTDLDYLLRVLAPVLPGGVDQATLKERIAPVIKLDKIRMAQEMAEARVNADGIVEAGCPDLSSLHGVSLKREVKRLLVELAGTSAQLKEAVQERDALASALSQAISRNALGTESMPQAMWRLWVGLRRSGDRLTGGGLRALVKRMLRKSLRQRHRPADPTR
jgi:hypothetical protein